MTTKLSQRRLPNVPHLPDKAGRANERRRVQRTEGKKATKAQQKVHGQSETVCISSAPSSPVLTACSNKANSATAEKSTFPVNKMPLIGLTPACPDPPEDYFCACTPAVPSTITAYPQAPKDMVAIVLPDCKATVTNLRLLLATLLECRPHVCCVKIALDCGVLLQNSFVSTKTNSMQFFVNWILLRI